MPTSLPEHAAVVIVGGGVIGTSIAFSLAEAGVRDVVLLERDELGSGSTSRAAGGVRAAFSDALNIQIGARSLEAFARFGQRPGSEIDFHRDGYLFLLETEHDVAAFERSVSLQNDLGVPSRMIGVEEAMRHSPIISGDGLRAAVLSPADGRCTPEAVVQGYAVGARRQGARLERSCEVLGIDVTDGEIKGVRTSRGRVATSTVICAAGAWSARIGAMVGVDLPVLPYRRQILVAQAIPGLPPALPFTIDFSTSFYFHREGRGLLVGMSDPKETPGFKLEPSDDWLPRLTAAISRRAPQILDAGVVGGWAGLYEVTPDHNALIGQAPSPSRFLYATGFSGHGFLQGPAVGEIVRDLYLDRPPFVDVTPLRAERFADSDLRPEYNVV